jgi:hypothetical protein
MFTALLRKEWQQLSEDTQGYIMRDIEETFGRDDKARASASNSAYLPLGHDQDRAEWTTVRNLWRKPNGLWLGEGGCPDCGQRAVLCLCGHAD